ncbi:MAG TPA: hypothetical protein EYP77_10220, partial [Anaerolineae bacterium]|nr:hypothetical protein [Anaerolineae bacterium]
MMSWRPWDEEGSDDGYASPAAQVMAEAIARKNRDTDVYVLLLTEVRDALTTRQVLTPAQMENPSHHDMQQAEALVRDIVTRYEQRSHAQGLPPL